MAIKIISKTVQVIFSMIIHFCNKVRDFVCRKPSRKRMPHMRTRSKPKLRLNLHVARKESKKEGDIKTAKSLSMAENVNSNIKRRYKVRRILSKVRYVTVPLSNGQVILERFSLNNNEESISGGTDACVTGSTQQATAR